MSRNLAAPPAAAPGWPSASRDVHKRQVLGSPVYYGAIAGGMKCFLDRLFYAGKPPRYKVGAAVCTLRRGGGIAAYDQLLSYLQLSEMVLAPTRYWQAVHGNTPEELAQDLEGMQTLRETAASMAWMLESLHLSLIHIWVLSACCALGASRRAARSMPIFVPTSSSSKA